MRSECEIGRIRKVQFGVEDHGVLGLCIDFDFGGSVQGYGWFMLAPMADNERTREGWSDAQLARNLRKIVELHNFLDVDELSEAKGMAIEVLRERMPNPMVYKHGAGPEGAKCKTCRHVVQIRPGQNRYWKCDRRSLSHSQTSDHRLKWPACRLYEEEK